MAYKRKIGKTLIKGAVAVAAVNAAVCAVVVSHKKKKEKDTDNLNAGNPEKNFDIFMQGRQIKLGEDEFEKVKIKTVMGGVDLDLRESVITEDVFINLNSFMGGVNMRVPEGVNVVVKGKTIMGGITNFVPVIEGENVPTIFVKAKQVMGGLCIKPGAPDAAEEDTKEDTCDGCETCDA